MKKKKIVSFLACGLGLLLGAVQALASSEPFLQNYQTAEGELSFDMAAQERTVAADRLQVTLSGEELEVTRIETTAGIPVTYYCLVDVSGSMREEQFSQVKEALLAIRDGMKDGDNLVLATLGNEVESSGFLSGGQEITEAIDALAVGNEDTNLYSGIVESIRLLEENPEVCERKCLVILSDGKDDQKTGITKSEADTAIVDSRIPVYTVATLRGEQTEEQLEDAKLLGSFANESAGGAHYAPVLQEEESARDAGEAIAKSMKQGFHVTADVSEYEAQKDVLLLRVIYQDGDGVRTEDSLDVYAQELQYAQAGPDEEKREETESQSEAKSLEEPESQSEAKSPEEPENQSEAKSPEEPEGQSEAKSQEEPESQSEAESQAEPENEAGKTEIPAVAIAAVVGAVLLLIVILLVLRKKKAKKKDKEKENEFNPWDVPGPDDPAPEEKKETGTLPEEEKSSDDVSDQPDAEKDGEEWEEEKQPEPQTPEPRTPEQEEPEYRAPEPKVPEKPVKRYKVTFTAIGYENMRYVLWMEEKKVTTVGRTSAAQLVLNGDDSRLSGVHCKMSCRKDRIEVWDAGSKNGTFLNGVRLAQGISGYVENQGRIRIGSYEYRVSITE